PAQRGGSRHRAGSRGAARATDGDGQAARQHSGLARPRSPASRRPARPAVPHAVRKARPSVAERQAARVTFRLLTYNIWKGGAGRVEAIARVIEVCRPDVVLLQEATNPDVVAALAERTGMPAWRSFGRQSLAYLSRRAVDHAEWHRPRFSRHAFIEVVPAGVPIRLFGLHLSAVHAAWTERRRVFELRPLLRSIA